jgi:membrane protein YqaA with SNARE-associated domain
MAMVAGTLRMNVVVFFVAGLLGRTLFFWAWLTGVGLIFN